MNQVETIKLFSEIVEVASLFGGDPEGVKIEDDTLTMVVNCGGCEIKVEKLSANGFGETVDCYEKEATVGAYDTVRNHLAGWLDGVELDRSDFCGRLAELCYKYNILPELCED